MTHESSNDSPRHEPGISPRRAARAARENAERQRAGAQAPAAGDPSADPDPAGASTPGGTPAGESLPERHGTARHHAAPAPGHQAPAEAEATSQEHHLELPAATAASEEAARAAAAARDLAEERARTAAEERSKALDAAQRARTQSAQRARKEAIEAQRAAAERVRQTLRANAAPLRDRSAAARSAITPDSAHAAPSIGQPVVPPLGASAAGPFDQDASQHRTGASAPAADPVPTQAQALSTPGPQGPPAYPASPPAAPRSEAHAAPEVLYEAPSRQQHPQDDDLEFSQEAAESRPSVHADPHAPSEAPGMDPHIADAHHLGYRDADHQDPGHTDAGHHEAGHHYGEHLPADHYDGAGGYPVEPDEALERENLFLTTMQADPKARKTRRRRRNWVVLVVLLGFCAVIFGVVVFLQGLMERLNPQDFPAPGGAPVSFEVKSGWGPKQIGRELENRDIVASDKLFLEAIQLVDTENREIHPGTYDLRQEMPALDAATILIGEPAAKVSYVAIKQNTRISGVLEEISKSTGLELEELQALSEDPKAFGIKSGASNLEGYLHPGEYRFPLDADAKTVLKAMVDATGKTLKANGITDSEQQYHVLKVASILQAEARKDDYATVAGALENRLHPNNTETNGLLQVDSAVIYGLDRYTLQISAAEKVDAGNPYNTYEHKGLPPTPIGSPGDSAIKAAANPTPNDYYYWVTVNTNTGETKFARTYAEHRVYQNEFRSWCAANTDVCK